MEFKYRMFNAPSAHTIDRAAELGCNWVIVHSAGIEKTAIDPATGRETDTIPIYFEDYPKIAQARREQDGPWLEPIRREVSALCERARANGLKVDNPVKIVGVDVGKVTAIDIVEDGVEVVMKIEEGRVIRRDSVATITLGGFLGAKYVEITLGSKRAPALKPGESVQVNNPPDLNAIVAKAVSAINAIADFTESFAEAKEFFKSLKETGPKLKRKSVWP